MSDKSTHSYYHEDKYAEWLDSLPQSNSEVVGELLRAAYEGESVQDLTLEESEANRIRTELKGLRAEIEAKESLIEEYESVEKERVEATPDYDDQLYALLETIAENGTKLWPDHERVQELATMEHKQPEQVLDDAKEIAKDMNHTFYNTDFMTAQNAKHVEKEPINNE